MALVRTTLFAAVVLAAVPPAKAGPMQPHGEPSLPAWALGGNQLQQVNLETGDTSPGPTLSQPVAADGLTLSASGELLAFSSGRLVAIDLATGQVDLVKRFDISQDELVVGLAEDACGRLFLRVVDLVAEEGQIRRLDLETGTTETVAVLPFVFSTGLAIRGEHALVKDPANGGMALARVHLDTGTVTTLLTDRPLPWSGGYDLGPNGELWLVEAPSPIPAAPPSLIWRLDLTTGAVTHFAPFSTGRIATLPPAGQCIAGVPSIPALTPTGLLALAAAVALGGSVLLARGRRRGLGNRPAGLALSPLVLALVYPGTAAAEPFGYTVKDTQLSRLDLHTGEAEGIAGLLQFHGLALPPFGSCGGGPAVAIPTASHLGLVLLAILLADAALWIGRHRPKAACGLLASLLWLPASNALAEAEPQSGPQLLAWTVLGNEIQRIDLETGETAARLELSESVLTEGLTLSASGKLLAFGKQRLVSIDPATGRVEFLRRFDLSEYEFVLGLAEDTCGRLFIRVLDMVTLQGQIRRLDLTTGTTETIAILPAVLATGLTVRGSYAFAKAPSTNGQKLARVHLDTGTAAELPVDGPLPWLGGFDFAPDGALWFASEPLSIPTAPRPVRRVDLATGSVTEHPPLAIVRLATLPPGGQCIAGVPTIPTASPGGLLILAMALALAAGFQLGQGRRKRSRLANCALAALASLLLLLPASTAHSQTTGYSLAYSELREVDLVAGGVLSRLPLSEPILEEGITLSASGQILAFARDRLLEIDPATGAVTTLGQFEIQEEQYVHGLAEDACGRVFVRILNTANTALRFYRLDLDSSSLEFVGELTPPVLTHGLAIRGTRIYTIHPTLEALSVIDIDRWTNVTIPIPGLTTYTTGMDFGPNGDLWIAGPPPFPGIVTPVDIQQVNISTGTTTSRPRQYLNRLAVSRPSGSCAGSPQEIPTLNPLGLLVLGLSLSLAALWIRRRSWSTGDRDSS